MALTVTGQERDAPGADAADHDAVRRRAEARVDDVLLGLLEAREPVQAGAADDGQIDVFAHSA